ncbi:MBL fold metallo-hydrolase [Lutibaculum baratangense]|uniref:Metal-dependent hydrolases of the beta-lactamase superfamily I n=1 Tax=Lutibaculum baratangense AMV1 TaxID=631454 RepID=V4T788_9HYPH|nr:MBL fold metallo-hydrolase [Lutibaculum baratangense]ESR22483.1 Metal-dependent hydrolases of the beta-lactamase superfamily I [Lutibaculum baratangense AMV1]
MSLVATILGCGSSAGVPRLGSGWGACEPAEPKNRRRRCALLVERHGAGGTTRVLVDTGPDLREQLLAAEVDRLDGVLISHDHADHTHGIDDLRPLVIHGRRRIRVHMEDATRAVMLDRFRYCFEAPPDSLYPPILDMAEIRPPHAVLVEGPGGSVEALPIPVEHGPTPALGFRFGDLAYMPDVSHIPESSARLLQNLDVFVVDALRYSQHISHFSVADALSWIERLKPRRAVLTNLHHDLDYNALKAELPEHVEPAYDGMRLTLSE